MHAILHGGVPVREVEDEYIQEEILKGFDVSAVFDKRDEEYFDFKASIETTDSLREVCGSNDAAVVSQLERWWDKYRVSLGDLDLEVNEAEKAMKGFLAELGYE